MDPVRARGLYIKKEAHEDPRSMARVERMLPFIEFAGEPEVIDDEAWHALVSGERFERPRHGRRADEVEPIVVFNQFLYQHSPEEQSRRRERYPELFRPGHGPYGGYGGWDWRASGEPEWRRSTGLVCQPAYAIHSLWGCHFRCMYCDLGHVANVYVNLEDWTDHIRQGLASLEKSPSQVLFQWDNGTDISCWEPEYGGTKMLVELFAREPGKYLEIYVGKSDNVDYLLDYGHRGHTVCCWSLATETQVREVEKRTASMEARLRAARKCQEAGYPVRMRLSPIVPTVGWEPELRRMIARLFEEVDPEVITIEPLRFFTHHQLCADLPPGLIDTEFVEAMREVADTPDPWQRSQFPDRLRMKIYRVVLEEVERISPHTPVALCREKKRVWDALGKEFERMGQHPGRYVCNCGPTSAGPNPLLCRGK